MKISCQVKKPRLRTRVINKIENVSPQNWSKIFPKVPEGYYFLKTLDESNFAQFSFYYILVYDKKELVGAAPCFFLNYSLDTSINGPLRRLTNTIKRKFPDLFSLKALVCGIPMGQGQIGIAAHSAAVLEAIEMRMERLARKLKAPVTAFKDFDASYDRLFAPLARKGFLKLDSLPMTRMALDFKDFDGYLKTLGSDNRYNLRKKLKKASGVPMESKILSTLDDNTLDEAYGLYLQVVNSHEMGFEIVPKEFFRLIAKNMPDETKFFLVYIDGKLAAFTFCLACEGLLLDYYLGFDYAKAKTYNLFFTKFQQILNWCLENDYKVYEMGATGYDGKRRLGFDFVPVHIYAKFRYQFLRPFFKILCSLLKFENFEPELKQWKKSLKSAKSR